MEFHVLYGDAMRYHEQFVQNEKYRSIAEAVQAQGWLINERALEPQNDADTTIVFCGTEGAKPPLDKEGELMWEPKFGMPSIKIKARADTPAYYTKRGFFHKRFVEAVLLYVYPHSLRGRRRHLIGMYNGYILKLLLVDFDDKDKLLQSWSNPQSDKQELLQSYYPEFPSTLSRAMKEAQQDEMDWMEPVEETEFFTTALRF